MKQKVILALVSMCVAMILVAFSSAQEAEKLPSMDDVISRYVKSVGEVSLLEKRWTLDLRGQCESSVAEESGPIEVIVQGSELFMRLNEGELLMGVNHDTFWRHPRDNEIVKIPAAAIAETVAIFDPARILHWKQKFPGIAITGTQKVDDHETYVVETKPGDPAGERLFLDRTSGLLIREEVLAKHEVFTFADFHIIDGIQMPLTIRQITPGPSYTYKFTNAKHVPEVDDATFQPH